MKRAILLLLALVVFSGGCVTVDHTSRKACICTFKGDGMRIYERVLVVGEEDIHYLVQYVDAPTYKTERRGHWQDGEWVTDESTVIAAERVPREWVVFMGRTLPRRSGEPSFRNCPPEVWGERSISSVR